MDGSSWEGEILTLMSLMEPAVARYTYEANWGRFLEITEGTEAAPRIASSFAVSFVMTPTGQN